MNQMPTITPSYCVIPPRNTNSCNSKTENIALGRVEFELYGKNNECSCNTKAGGTKTMIVERYLKEDFSYDEDIWINLNIGRTKYYKSK